ncbi:MAG: hypothetical protein RMM08_08415 [Armatimonadota bacterium]|nr:hypothetical protein [Armatimonadota bacterium]
MIWQMLRIVCVALCSLWALVVLASLISAGLHIQRSDMLRARKQAFEAVGVMRGTGKPVIAMLHRSNRENLNLGYPPATVVKREEVSFDPLAVQKALPRASKEFWTYGGENLVEVRVFDANADGRLDVLFQYDLDTLFEPTAHFAYLYTVINNEPEPLLVVQGEKAPLQRARLSDGTYAFFSPRTVWQGKAYRWNGSAYRLMPYNGGTLRAEIVRRMLDAPAWEWLVSLAPAIALLLNGWTCWKAFRAGKVTGRAYWTSVFAHWTVVLGVGLLFWWWLYPRFYTIGFVVVPLLLPWLVGLGVAGALTAGGIRYNRSRGDSDGDCSGKTGGTVPGVGW